MDMSYWLMFLTVTLALNISPGPDVIFVLTKTMSHGRKAGLVASIGACCGAMVHVAAGAFIVEIGYIFAAHFLTQKVKSNQRFNLWLDRVFGAAFMTLGVKLAIT